MGGINVHGIVTHEVYSRSFRVFHVVNVINVSYSEQNVIRPYIIIDKLSQTQEFNAKIIYPYVLLSSAFRTLRCVLYRVRIGSKLYDNECDMSYHNILIKQSSLAGFYSIQLPKTR